MKTILIQICLLPILNSITGIPAEKLDNTEADLPKIEELSNSTLKSKFRSEFIDRHRSKFGSALQRRSNRGAIMSDVSYEIPQHTLTKRLTSVNAESLPEDHKQGLRSKRHINGLCELGFCDNHDNSSTKQMSKEENLQVEENYSQDNLKKHICHFTECDDDSNVINCPKICESPEDMLRARICKDMGCDKDLETANQTCPDLCSSLTAGFMHEMCTEIGCMLENKSSHSDSGTLNKDNITTSESKSEEQTQNIMNIANRLLKNGQQTVSSSFHFKQSVSTQRSCPEHCKSPTIYYVKNVCTEIGCIGTTQLNMLQCPNSCKSPICDSIEIICKQIGCMPEHKTQNINNIACMSEHITQNMMNIGNGMSNSGDRKNVASIFAGASHHFKQGVSSQRRCPDSCRSPTLPYIDQICKEIGCILNGNSQNMYIQQVVNGRCPSSCKSLNLPYIDKICNEIGCMTDYKAQNNNYMNVEASHQFKQTVSSQRRCPNSCQSPSHYSANNICAEIGCMPNGEMQNIGAVLVKMVHCPDSCKFPPHISTEMICKEIGCIPEQKTQTIMDLANGISKGADTKTGGSVFVETTHHYKQTVTKQIRCPDSCNNPSYDFIEKMCTEIGCMAKGKMQNTGIMYVKLVQCPESCKFPTHALKVTMCKEIGCMPEHKASNMNIMDLTNGVPQGGNLKNPSPTFVETSHQYNKQTVSTQIRCPDSCNHPSYDFIEKMCRDIGCVQNTGITHVKIVQCPEACKFSTHPLQDRMCQEIGCIPKGKPQDILDVAKVIDKGNDHSNSNLMFVTSVKHTTVSTQKQCPDSCKSPSSLDLNNVCIKLGCTVGNSTQNSMGLQVLKYEPEKTNKCPDTCLVPKDFYLAQLCERFGCKPSVPFQLNTNTGNSNYDNTPCYCPNSCQSPRDNLRAQFCKEIECLRVF